MEAHRIDSLAMFYASIGAGKEGVQAFREKREPEFSARIDADLPPFYAEWTRRRGQGCTKDADKNRPALGRPGMWQLRTSVVAASVLADADLGD